MILLFVVGVLMALLPLAALSAAIALVWVFAAPLWLSVTVTVIAGVLILWWIAAYYVIMSLSCSPRD